MQKQEHPLFYFGRETLETYKRVIQRTHDLGGRKLELWMRCRIPEERHRIVN